MQQVTFLPVLVAKKLRKPTNVISIISPYDPQPQFEVEHKRLLRLSFFPFGVKLSEQMKDCRLTPEITQQIVDFAEKCKGEEIIVHCGEGRVRSPAVAMFIESLYEGQEDGWYLALKYPGCLGHTAGMDRELRRALNAWRQPPTVKE